MSGNADFIHIILTKELKAKAAELELSEGDIRAAIADAEASGDRISHDESLDSWLAYFSADGRGLSVIYANVPDEYLMTGTIFRVLDVSEPAAPDVKKYIDDLTAEVRFHNDLYYYQDRNIITDAEYDLLLLRLQRIESSFPDLAHEDSPTRQVGDKLKAELGRVAHRVPMLSIQAVFRKDDVAAFVEGIRQEYGEDIEFIVEPKVDGLSAAVRYKDGVYFEALTRGDGVTFGEDITENMKHIADMKLELPGKLPYIEIRGEVYCTDSSFESVNARREESGEMTFSNSRNCASATLRQKDPLLLDENELSLFLFGIQEIDGLTFESDSEALEYLKTQGLSVLPGCRVLKTSEEIVRYIEEIGKTSSSLGFQIDGAVVKVDSFKIREQMGETEKVPNWALAYKYQTGEKH